MGCGKRGSERAIAEELDALVSALKAGGRAAVDPTLPLHRAAANVIGSMLFGSRLAEDPRFVEFLEVTSFQVVRNIGISSNPLSTIIGACVSSLILSVFVHSAITESLL